MNLGGWSSWANYRSNNPTLDPHSILTNNFNLSSYVPQVGSLAIGAGTNLTGLGITQLDTDRAVMQGQLLYLGT
jgi:hypothetical protein